MVANFICMYIYFALTFITFPLLNQKCLILWPDGPGPQGAGEHRCFFTRHLLPADAHRLGLGLLSLPRTEWIRPEHNWPEDSVVQGTSPTSGVELLCTVLPRGRDKRPVLKMTHSLLYFCFLNQLIVKDHDQYALLILMWLILRVMIWGYEMNSV